MTDQNPARLGEILLEQKSITPDQMEKAFEEQKRSGRLMGEILVSEGAVTEEVVTKTLSEQLGIAYVDISQMISEPKALSLVPQDICQQSMAIPLYISQNMLTVAMGNALDSQAIDKMESVSGLRVRPIFACPSAVKDAVEKQYHAKAGGQKESASPLGSLNLSTQSTATLEKKDKQETQRLSSVEPLSSMKQDANLGPVIDIVNDVITKAVDVSASDIHLEPREDRLKCRYRIDGILHEVDLRDIPAEKQAAVISRVKIMADMDIAEKRLPQDGRIQLDTGEKSVDLRVSTFPGIYGENIVIRILDRSGGLLQLGEIGFSKENLKVFSQLIRRPYGIILVTGPTGSGKTTTLYAALSEVNTIEKNIVTLEDPVEYEIDNIRQSQVNVKAGLTFAKGLRSILRQDPDIIMIGEIRDRETADSAIHAALTGHLVLSTLHTNDASSAATRLIDMGVEPFLVASSVIGIVAQRLFRILCPSCKKEYTPPPELLGQLGIKHKPEKFYQEVGCKKCSTYGYLGRDGLYELLMLDDRIKDLISKKAPAPIIREEALKGGLKFLRDAGIDKIMQGITSVSEVLRVTGDV